MRLLALALGVTAVLAGAAAIVYLNVPAHSLPSVLGPLRGVRKPRAQRGDAAAMAAVFLFVLSGVVFAVGRRSGGSGSGRKSLRRIWNHVLGRD